MRLPPVRRAWGAEGGGEELAQALRRQRGTVGFSMPSGKAADKKEPEKPETPIPWEIRPTLGCSSFGSFGSFG